MHEPRYEQGRASSIKSKLLYMYHLLMGRISDLILLPSNEALLKAQTFIDRAKNYLFGLTHFIVVPYLFSTQSGVVAEALSHGKLIIVNDIPAFTHLKGLDFVFATDFNDEDAIVNCLKDLFNLDWTEYQKRYWNAVNYFRDNFSEIYLAKVMDDMMSNDKIT